MIDAVRNIDISQKRMLSVTEAQAYTGLGATYLRKWAAEVGALKKIGKRVLIDKHVLDAVIDTIECAPNNI